MITTLDHLPHFEHNTYHQVQFQKNLTRRLRKNFKGFDFEAHPHFGNNKIFQVLVTFTHSSEKLKKKYQQHRFREKVNVDFGPKSSFTPVLGNNTNFP